MKQYEIIRECIIDVDKYLKSINKCVNPYHYQESLWLLLEERLKDEFQQISLPCVNLKQYCYETMKRHAKLFVCCGILINKTKPSKCSNFIYTDKFENMISELKD